MHGFVFGWVVFEGLGAAWPHYQSLVVDVSEKGAVFTKVGIYVVVSDIWDRSFHVQHA